jgi:hypothetical protein
MSSIDLEVSELATQVRSYYDTVIVERGWDYYKQALVRGLRADENGNLIAQVIGSQIYKVSVNPVYLTKSSCNCPYGGYCKHIAAVLFEACKKSGKDPKELLELTTGRGFRSPWSEFQSAPKPSAKPKQAQTRKSFIPKPQEKGTPDEWQAYFDSQFAEQSIQGIYYTDSIVENVNRKLQHLSDHWEPIFRCFYLLHLQLFTMKLADSLYARLSGSHYYYDYSSLFARIAQPKMKQILQLVSDIDKLQVKESYPLHLAQTADFLTKHALKGSESTMMPWLDVYRLLWWSLLDQAEVMKQEQIRLKGLLDKGESGSSSHNALAFAYAHFDVISNRDEKAMSLLEKQVSAIDPGDVIGYLQTFVDLKEGARLLSWLRWLKPHVLRSQKDYISIYLKYWGAVLHLWDIGDEWKEVAISFLPDSFYDYSMMLLDQKRYQEWVDLCIFMNLTPYDLDAVYMKLVGEEDPRLLLPLYHYAAERFILEKNRDSYKRAVQILKKLHTTYKKIKEQDRWLQYIDHLSKQYSRYRAFQEELRKGKLLA